MTTPVVALATLVTYLELASFEGTTYQGCQMDYFQTKNPNFGKRALKWKMLLIL
jgi:hypothetical protein